MDTKIYNFSLNLDWPLSNLLSQIAQFNAEWRHIAQQQGQILQQLKHIATIGSVGGSTRIEGAKMTDAQIDTFLKNVDVTQLLDRDQQEVVGYYEALEMIFDAFPNIDISENHVLHLHNLLLKYSHKDSWHKGGYKQQNNSIQAVYPDGSSYIIFQTTPAGYPTEEAMNSLFTWYQKDNDTLALIKIAAFVYEILTIHPFQDGNGRLSRLISTLLLLKSGYNWIQYVSLEHEIEQRKAEYYQVLRHCQALRPQENITLWIFFFLSALQNIQQKLNAKLQAAKPAAELSPKEQEVVALINYTPNLQSSEIAQKLKIPLPTIKKILSSLVKKNILKKHGQGKSTFYSLG
jgi:Fic family protein